MAKRMALIAVALSVMSLPAARGTDGVPVIVFDGRGFGHGVGMAQDGAFWMGQAGMSTPQILGQFYPGTRLGKATGAVRVTVLAPQPSNDAVISFPSGGEIRDALSGSQSSGFPVRIASGGQARLHWDGSRYSVATGSGSAAGAPPVHSAGLITGPGPSVQQVPTTDGPPTTLPDATSTTSTTSAPTTTTTSSPRPTTTAPVPPTASTGPSSTRTLWAVPNGSSTVTVLARSRTYRGAVEATAEGTPLRLVDQVDVEQYLRGMGEVRDPSWPPAALRTQAIAARTYAMRAMLRGGELCDDTRCQVYLGAQAEYGAMDRAVSDTKTQALFFDNSLASAVYSANGGGVEATRQEGFGSPDDSAYPYLRSAPYLTKDPMPWTVKVATTDVASRLGYAGRVTALTVAATGPSGRVLQLTIAGTTGSKTVTGIAAAGALGLRSTLFTVRAETDAVAPPPPGQIDASLQVAPEDAASAPALPTGPPTAGPLSIPDLPPIAPAVGAARLAHGPGRPVAVPLASLLLLLLAAAATGAVLTARRAGLGASVLFR